MNGLTRGTIVTRYLWTYREEISAENGPLFEGHSLIFPEKLRNRTLQTIHRGHCGVDKMQLRAREFVFWARISADILQTAQSCNVRQTFSNSEKHWCHMKSPKDLGRSWPLISSNFILTAIFWLRIFYSRFPVIRRVCRTTASATIDILKQDYGVPKTVMSDNGPQFASNEFEAFASQCCFDRITSSPRYPQSNGKIEQMVQTVKQCMKKCAETWHDPYLAMLICRTTPLSNSITSPAELLNGRKYRALLPTRTLMQSSHEQNVRE